MKYSELFASHVDAAFRGTEAEKAIAQFMRRIPRRVLQMEFDASRSNKQGVKDGNKVYKLGLDLSNSATFIEYFEHFNQGQPTMVLIADKAQSLIIFSGWKVGKKMFMQYCVENGKVKKAVQID